MLADLRASLSAAGHATHLYEMPDGSRLLLLPYGARLLGLYPPDNDDNFYWTHPALRRPETASVVFGGSGWHNTGGDRTWITPELDIFFPDYPDTRRHWEPPQLDACEYEIMEDAGRIGMARNMSLHFARAHRDVEMELTKWYEPAPNPLRWERDFVSSLACVRYAGYTQCTTLTLTNGSLDRATPAGIWNLIQLPHGGELLIPTYTRARPRILFGDIPADRLVCSDRLVQFRTDFPGEHKIAVRAAQATGRAGYLRRMGEVWSLVVRNFFVQPSGEYVDVPKDDPGDFGYAFHAVNVLSDLGDFCELEYHAPAIGRYKSQNSCLDVSQVWAFRGPAAFVRDIAHLLLGVE